MSRNIACFRHRSARLDTGSSTRCRRHRHPAHRPGPLVPARAACAACTCRQNRRRLRRHRRFRFRFLRRGFCGKPVARRTFELPRILIVLPTAFYPRARKRKRQNSPAGLHILRRGILDPHGEKAMKWGSLTNLVMPGHSSLPCADYVHLSALPGIHVLAGLK